MINKNKEKARKLAIQSTLDVDDSGNEVYNAFVEAALLEMAEWKDEQYKEREEGLRETIDTLDVKLQKANEDGMYYFDKCNIQKQQLIDKACEWLRNNSYMLDNWDEDKYWVAFEFTSKDEMIKDFRKAMKGGEE